MYICEAKTKMLISFAVTDLRVCFLICKKRGFHNEAHYVMMPTLP